MFWKIENAVLQTGWRTKLIVNSDTYDPHPEVISFVITLNARERSPNTIKSYLSAIVRFLNWTDGVGVDWKRINILELTRYKRFLQELPTRGQKQRSSSSVRLALTSITEFLRFCAAEGLIEEKIAEQLLEKRPNTKHRRVGEGIPFHPRRINAVRVERTERAPEILSFEQASAMMDAASTARDRFLLRILYEGGPRIGEVLGMRTEDLHLLPNSRSLGCAISGAHFHIERRTDNTNQSLAKSKKPRSIPVTLKFINDYREYQHERYELLRDRQNGYLFVNYEGASAGSPMSYSNVYKIISRLANQNGFRATPHMFRHSAATAWIETGSEIDVVQELLGHASPVTTSVYLHASEERLRNAVIDVEKKRKNFGCS